MGRHILGTYDDETIVVYQAYKPEIGQWAAANGKLNGAPGFDPERITWIKTNFLWMMYRSNWATSKNQTCIIAIWLKREAFERYLGMAAHTVFYPEVHGTNKVFSKAMKDSTERLQWDPDHSPGGAKQARRAIQVGLRQVESFINGDDIIQIRDITKLCREQAKLVEEKRQDLLQTPRERVYTMSNVKVAKHIALAEEDIIQLVGTSATSSSTRDQPAVGSTHSETVS